MVYTLVSSLYREYRVLFASLWVFMTALTMVRSFESKQQVLRSDSLRLTRVAQPLGGDAKYQASAG